MTSANISANHTADTTASDFDLSLDSLPDIDDYKIEGASDAQMARKGGKKKKQAKNGGQVAAIATANDIAEDVGGDMDVDVENDGTDDLPLPHDLPKDGIDDIDDIDDNDEVMDQGDHQMDAMDVGEEPMEELESDTATATATEVPPQPEAEPAPQPITVSQPDPVDTHAEVFDTSYDFSDTNGVITNKPSSDGLNVAKKRVPSYLQPTISYSQKIRPKYDYRNASGSSSQRSFSNRTYSSEYHLREARLNEPATGGGGGARSRDSSLSSGDRQRADSREGGREFSREFTPSYPFPQGNV